MTQQGGRKGRTRMRGTQKGRTGKMEKSEGERERSMGRELE